MIDAVIALASSLAPAGAISQPEAMVMEDRSRRNGRVLKIVRAAEPSRLARQMLPAAYQRAVPILQRTLGDVKTQSDFHLSHQSPPAAAGVSA